MLQHFKRLGIPLSICEQQLMGKPFIEFESNTLAWRQDLKVSWLYMTHSDVGFCITLPDTNIAPENGWLEY